MTKKLKKEKKILRVLKIPKKTIPSFNPSKFKEIQLVKRTAERAVQTDKSSLSSTSCYRVMSITVPNFKLVLFSVLEQQKRRRFHPLRNLRRIFRRRTITSADNSPSSESVRKAAKQTEPVSSSVASTSEKNLRSATLSSISSVVSSSASSPSSPLAHQLLQTLQGKHTNRSRSPVKSQSHGCVLLVPKSIQILQQQQQIQNQNQLLSDIDAMYATNASSSLAAATTYHQRQQQHAFNMSSATSKSTTNTSLMTTSAELQGSALSTSHRSSTMGGVAVLPSAFNAALGHSFFAERQKLKSLGDSSQELDSSANSSLGSSSRRNIGGNESNAALVSANGSGGEMTDSQRSFSEGRLVDSDYSRDGLSQSHDSVFSESATASSLSIVLKAELADALRKRRNRPDASDEDLGLPRSPASPQRRSERSNAAATTTTPTTAGNQSDVSSLSMLSMNSTEGDSMLTDSTTNAALHERSNISMTSSKYSRNSTMNSSSSSDVIRLSSTPSKSENSGEVDLFSSNWQRLSHSAAKHKMAVRPTKKKGPSRQHRRTLETSIPEANEDLFRISSSHLSEHKVEKDVRSKIQSMPPVSSGKLQAQVSEKELPSKTQDTATEPRKNQIKPNEGPRSNDNKRSKMDLVKPEIPEKPSPSASTASFGLRTLTAKATAIFESRSEHQQNIEREKVEELAKTSQPSPHHIETTESGFLRRLIQRNSKRTLPKATTLEDKQESQCEPKKLQISTSAYEPRDIPLSTRLSQAHSAIAYDHQVEQTRKEIKREILSEAGLGVMLSPYLFTNNDNDASPQRKSCNSLAPKDSTEPSQKPKSGPAARQRYLPQEIFSSNEKTPSTTIKVPFIDTVSSNSSISLSKSVNEESFQSVSIIREITASQALSSSKSEHHLFEKRPKIIGLSAFQQKVTRANESHLRSQSSNSSSNSLEVKDEGYFFSSEQKQRKSVEKSRSFRTYNNDKELDLTSVRSNMPSLPDLSLQLPTFNEFILNEKEYSSPSPPELGDKCVSLGFEINDNNLVRPSLRAESANSLGKASCKLSAPSATILPSLSPTNSCSNDISEIEENIERIVKSPYVSVMRKSATVSEEMSNKMPGSAKKLVESTSRNSLVQLKESKITEPKTSPTKAQHTVPMRERPIAIPEKLNSELPAKEMERKSIAASNPASASKISTNSRPRRSASVVESSTPEVGDTSIPEFLKIQLNRVDPGTRALKSTVVLAKNVKEPSPTVTKDIAERSVSNDDLSLRRYSTESLEIVENEKLISPEKPVSPLFEAINKQTKSLSTNSIQSSCSHSETAPKTITIKKHVATLTSQTPPTLMSTATINTAGNNHSTGTTPTDEVVVLRHKPPMPTVDTTVTTATTVTNKLSLQERKRVFMNEDKTKADKKIEELKNERKKSISEDLQRKSSGSNGSSSSNKTDLKESTAEESNVDKETVILRKKSFGVTQQTNALHGSISNNNINITANSTSNNKDDATPELMKVFARRSLKVKDEDLVNLADKILSTPISSSSSALKKSTSGQSNVDSDKENQSASEEKLDKITNGHLPAEQINSKMLISNTVSTISLGSSISNTTIRSSQTDFRPSVISFKSVGNGKALALSSNNNNNNNNNNNSNNSTHSNNNNNNSLNSTATLSTKCSLPSLRVGSGLRSLSNVNEQRSVSECNSSNNNNNNSNNHQNTFNNQAKLSAERQSLCLRATTTNVADSGSKTIERSATVGEFKGILQRRAEWEQRAMEALK